MFSLSHILHTERETRRFRLLSVVLVSVTLYFRQEEVNLSLALGGAFVFLLYTMALGPIFSRLAPKLTALRPMMGLVAAMALVDGISVAFLVHFVGGINSVVVILIPLFIIYHTIYLGYTSGLISVVLFSGLYLGLAFWEEEAQGIELGAISPVLLFYLLPILSVALITRVMAATQTQEALHKIFQDQGASLGVEVKSLKLSGLRVSLKGKVSSDEVLVKYVASLQKVPRVASLRLSSVQERRNGAVNLSFEIGVRLKAAPVRIQLEKLALKPKVIAPKGPSQKSEDVPEKQAAVTAAAAHSTPLPG